MRIIVGLIASLYLVFGASQDLKQIHDWALKKLAEKVAQGPSSYSTRARVLTGRKFRLIKDE